MIEKKNTTSTKTTRHKRHITDCYEPVLLLFAGRERVQDDLLFETGEQELCVEEKSLRVLPHFFQNQTPWFGLGAS